ncbi:TetR/AcrR family transcriptional regulator [Cupriavidus sp. AU9028]|uniref:TetR/AcrR family transcriptional regulator n=1 Tax=Cupriavidus sp. AU9028 TaxID=2871157 RepID=UPI001C959FF6|nr:TetR/AcrR family transcriptional regulator [Cupriavidus sp. AU9028]
MPRSSRAQTQKNRDAIEAASSRLFRERGLNGVGVADLMAAAGLTHGGFYSHFDSKDALAARACELAFVESFDRWEARMRDAADAGTDKRAAVADPYLSIAHRDRPGRGCPAVALAVDVGRESAEKPVRRAYAEGLQGLVERWAQTVDDPDPQARHQRALAELSTMVGAVMLARATAGDALSEDLLAAARAALGLPSPDIPPPED